MTTTTTMACSNSMSVVKDDMDTRKQETIMSTRETTKPTGHAAALELWDMIQQQRPHPRAAPVKRFAEAQHGRTLHHPNLPQPLQDEEQQQQTTTLTRRLSKALLKASPSGGNLLSNKIPQELSSPTSTLQFPGDHYNYQEEEDDDAPFMDEIGPSPTSTLNFPCDYHYEQGQEDEEEEPILFQQKLELEPQEEPQRDVVVVKPFVVRGGSTEQETHSPQHSFVVCADTQIGMTSGNEEWETELAYSRQAISLINSLEPRPLFCCICGDLVDMQRSFYSPERSDECDAVQTLQNEDFRQTWQEVHPDIALVCLCGNHDVGNRPNAASIDTYRNAFGDDYLAFWVNGTYNIVLNSNLFGDPTDAWDLYQEQLRWLQQRLEYASAKGATQIFVFGHHPWFLYDETEEASELKGVSPYPQEWNREGDGFPDAYFAIPKPFRTQALELFQKYNVSACFSGHFHQNLCSQTSWGMDMIVTAPLSMVFESSGKPASDETNGRGVRVVTVDTDTRSFVHRFEVI